MTKPVTIPNTFATATTAIPLSQLDSDFSTVATALNDANTYSNYAADTGVANAYVVTLTGVSTTYSAGLRIQFKAGAANTGASTLNVNSGGTKNITFQDASALSSGTIAANAIVDVMYDGTQFLLMNDPAGTVGTGDVVGPAGATANAVVRFDSTTGKLVKNSVVTIADSTGDVAGVGALSATGNVSFDGGTFVFNESGADKDFRIEGDTDANLFFTDASTDRVGIGTSSPTGRLNVSAADTGNVVGSGAATINITNSNEAAFGRTTNLTFSSGTGVAANTIAAISGVYTSFGTSRAGALAFSTDNGSGSFTERVRITSGGNVGIGTSSPDCILQVEAADGAAGGAIRYTATGVCSAYMSADPNGLCLATDTAGITFRTGISGNDPTDTGTERARITSGGNLLVGKTSSDLGTAGIEIFGAGYGQFTANNDASLFSNRLGSDGDTVKFYRATSLVGSISVTTSATAYNTSSDYRLKDNPQPLTGSGAFIDSLKPKTWNWKTDGSKGVGFIAHEVQEVSPASVTGEKDGEQMQAMEYGSAEFIANIIAELQSLRARLAAAGL
jgi:hypothetical protein